MVLGQAAAQAGQGRRTGRALAGNPPWTGNKIPVLGTQQELVLGARTRMPKPPQACHKNTWHRVWALDDRI